jgi:hypothetical protein
LPFFDFLTNGRRSSEAQSGGKASSLEVSPGLTLSMVFHITDHKLGDRRLGWCAPAWRAGCATAFVARSGKVLDLLVQRQEVRT